MLSAVLGLFSQDLAVDPGSAFTRIHQRGAGIVQDEPSIVAVRTHRDGRRTIQALARDAAPMPGRTPEDVDPVRPIRDGAVADFEVFEALLLHLVRRVHGRNSLIRPKMVVAVADDAADMARRAIRECCEHAGAREVQLVPRAIAAAIGAGLDVEQPTGCMVLDLGAGGARAAVISLGRCVVFRAAPAGGDAFDQAVVRHLERHHALLVGKRTAETAKCGFGTRELKGRCLRMGTPRRATLPEAELVSAMVEPVNALSALIRTTLEATPPELATDILETGLVLTGSAARLVGLDAALTAGAGLPVVVADAPEHATARGVGMVLEGTRQSALRAAS